MLRAQKLTAFLLIIFLVGCAAPKRQVSIKSSSAPEAVYCNDATGHFTNAKPWISGGKCCCTPTRDMFAVYQSEGTVEAGVTYEQFMALFTEKGIVTDLDSGYIGSNNRDDHGPHVVLGGKSMVTPTPGTYNFEAVVSGGKVKPFGIPIDPNKAKNQKKSSRR